MNCGMTSFSTSCTERSRSDQSVRRVKMMPRLGPPPKPTMLK